MADLVGQQIGVYRLVKKLGEGGFAEVYLAENVHVENILVAIKILKDILAEKAKEQFFKEASTISELEHPHIIKLRHFDLHNGLPYLVMDYIKEGSLRKRYPEGTKLALSTIVGYVIQIADALQHAHDRGIVHRDIKPDNILWKNENNLLVSDFGIATASYTRGYSEQENLGTLPYMSPEHFQAKAQSASDQYSLSIVVYEWLCGTPPFTEGNSLQMAYQHTYVSPPPLHDKIDIPSPIEGIVLQALAKNPKERFSTVQAFAQVLEEACKIAPIGTKLQTYTGHTDRISVVWSPNGTRLASDASDNTIQVWEANSGQLLHTYIGHSEHVWSVAWSPDGTWLASGSFDGTVRVWEANTGRLLYVYMGHTDRVHTVAWSPDGWWLASGSNDNTVQVWEVKTGKRLHTYKGHSKAVNVVAWSPDGLQLASGSIDKTVQVWAMNTGKLLYTYTGHSGNVHTIAWSPDGRWLASGSADYTVQVWEVNTGWRLHTYTGHTEAVYTVAWSPDGSHLAFGSADNTIEVWEATGRKQLYTYTGHTSFVNAIAWSPDGTRLASGSSDYTVQVWQAT